MTTTVIVNIGTLDAASTAFLNRLLSPTAEVAAAVPSLPEATAAQPGERYAGIVLKEDGTPSHHLFALPVSDKRMTYAQAVAWMDSVGSRPTRSEGAQVYANLRQHFKSEWHWLGDEYSAGSAWCQHFYDGCQFSGDKSYEFLALAVRRLVI